MGCQNLAINPGLNPNQPCQAPSSHKNIVYGMKNLALRQRLSFQHGPLFNPALTIQQPRQILESLISFKFSHKSQVTQVYAHNGHSIRNNSSDCPQYGAITADAQD